MIKINMLDGLIGDFLGSVPAVQRFASRTDVCCTHHPEVRHLFEMTGLKEYKDSYHISKEISIGCTYAWNIAIPKGLHMTQAYFPLVGLDIPDEPVKAEINVPKNVVRAYDYIIAPFSRSLPEGQKVIVEEWQRLVDMLPDKKFCIIGSDSDPEWFVTGRNVTACYGQPLSFVLNLIQHARDGLISVVSGPSHMAFHLGVKNYLITNQVMAWGNNPDAKKIIHYIPDIRAEQIKEAIYD